MAQSLIIRAKNNTGSTIPLGKAVYISGLDEAEQIPLISLASSDNENKLPSIGITGSEIENNFVGTIRTSGILAGIDTSNVEINTGIFVGQNGNLLFEGQLSSELTTQQLGVVLSSDPNGQIFLFPMEVRKNIKHEELLDVFSNQHHVENHANRHSNEGDDPLKLPHNDLIGISENQHHDKDHASAHSSGGSDDISGAYLPRAEIAIASITKNDNQTASGSWANITGWTNEDVVAVGCTVSLSLGTITVVNAGTYRISYFIPIELSGEGTNDSTIQGRITSNGSAIEQSRSRAATHTVVGSGSCTTSFIVTLAAGDELILQNLHRTATNATPGILAILGDNTTSPDTDSQASMMFCVQRIS